MVGVAALASAAPRQAVAASRAAALTTRLGIDQELLAVFQSASSSSAGCPDIVLGGIIRWGRVQCGQTLLSDCRRPDLTGSLGWQSTETGHVIPERNFP